MATEEILTKFTGDTSSLDAAIETASKELEQFAAVEANTQKQNAALNASLGSSVAKFNAVSTAAQLTGQGISTIDTNAKKAQTGLKGMFSGVVSFAKGARDGVRDAVKEVGGFRGILNQAKSNVSGFFGGIAKGAKDAATQIPGVGGLFSALSNPIGLATAAVVGFVANLSRLDSVGKVLDSVKFQFDGILQRLTSFEGIKGLFDQQALIRDAAFSRAYGEALDFIDEKQRQINESNADAQQSIASLNQRLRDRTKTEAERLAIADEITRIEVERAAKEEGLLKDKLGLIKLEIAARKSQGTEDKELNDELLNRQSEATVALKNAQTERISLLENVERRRNSIVEQGEAERKAISEKADAEQQKRSEKALAEQQKKAAQKLALEQELAKEIADAQTGQQGEESKATSRRDDRVKRAQGDAELLKRIEEQYQSDIAAIRAKYAAEQVAKQDEIAADLLSRQGELAQAQLDRLVEGQQEALMIAALTEGDITALAVKQAEERTALISAIENAAIEAKLIEFDAQYAAAEEAGIDTYDLTLAQEEELAELRQQFRDQENDAIKEGLKDQLEASAKAQEQRLELLSLGAETAANISTLVNTVAADNSAAARTALALAKASAIANAIISASQARLALTATPQFALGGPAAIAPQVAFINANLGIAIATILAQAITGNKEGDPYVTGKPFFNTSRDRHLRKLDEGERVVTAKDNNTYWDPLEDMRRGDFFDKWKPSDYSEAIKLNFAPRFNKVMDSPEGRRMAHSLSLPDSYDKNIVRAAQDQHREQRETNKLLKALISAQDRPRVSKRYRGRA